MSLRKHPPHDLASPVTEGWCAQAAAVCVPVRNEARLLPALLDALAGQAACMPGVATTLCILFDGCTDASAAIVAAAAATFPFAIVTAAAAPGAPANAGRARRTALALGQRATAGVARAALLTTDADSVPARDWIAATCRALAGADVVAGRIVRRGARHPAQDRVEAYLDRLFALRRSIDPVPWEPAPGHHFTGGASLAFRAEAYAALGGFSARACGEDAAIVDEAHRLGLRVRRDRAVTVETSARRIGRAAGGLADHLRALDGEGAQPAATMSHPADAAWQYHGHAAARAAWPALAQPGAVARLAERLGVDPEHVRRVAAETANAEAFAIRVVPAAPTAGRLIPLAEAERALAHAEQALRERAA